MVGTDTALALAPRPGWRTSRTPMASDAAAAGTRTSAADVTAALNKALAVVARREGFKTPK